MTDRAQVYEQALIDIVDLAGCTTIFRTPDELIRSIQGVAQRALRIAHEASAGAGLDLPASTASYPLSAVAPAEAPYPSGPLASRRVGA